MSSMLQERLEEFGVTVLNYINNQIHVDYFYNEERYEDFLKGLNCRQGMGLYDTDEILQFNKLTDGKMVIVQHDGVEVARYKYKTIFRAVIEYKDKNNKKRSLTFSLRKNEFGKELNFFMIEKKSEGDQTEIKSLDFANFKELKKYLSQEYGNYKLTDWSVYIE